MEAHAANRSLLPSLSKSNTPAPQAVRPTVAFATVIGERHTHALAHVLADSRLLRDIGECSVSVVVEQHRGLAFETGRRTVPADLTGEAGWLVLGRPLHVVDYEQVQISVVVVIKPTRADGPSLAKPGMDTLEPRLDGHVGEGTVAVVMKQLIPVDAGHEHILISVVVVVANRDPHAVSGAAQAG